MNCFLTCKLVGIFLLLTISTSVARWELTDFDKKFTSITASNGTLVGIEEKSNRPFKWEKPSWKKLSDEEFINLATNGTTIAGIKQRDKNAYILNSTTWKKLGTPFNVAFDQLVFGQGQLLGLGEKPYSNVFVWKNTSWTGVGWQKFWHLNASGNILCGIEKSYVKNELNYRASQWAKRDWQKLGTMQFTQLVTNGTRIVGVGKPPKAHVFEWTNHQWQQLGSEKITTLAFNKNILCGIQERIQLILFWNGLKWLALDTKKFIQAVTDGHTIYGLANDKKVYYWTNR